MSDCIFCKIVAGEIPCVKVREDTDLFVFLDIHPLRKWHCLIIPKHHYQDIFDIDDVLLQKIISTAKKIASRMKISLGATWVNLINASGQDAEQSVFHFHLHLVPRYANDGLHMNARRQTKVQNYSVDDMNAIAEEIQQSL